MPNAFPKLRECHEPSESTIVRGRRPISPGNTKRLSKPFSGPSRNTSLGDGGRRVHLLFTDGLFEVEVAEDEYCGAERLLAAVGKRNAASRSSIIWRGSGRDLTVLRFRAVYGRYVPPRSGTEAHGPRRFESAGCVKQRRKNVSAYRRLDVP
jgi:hypothetical protein